MLQNLIYRAIGAVISHWAELHVACARMAAKGDRPLISASERRIRTRAAAPSEIELEFAAVTVAHLGRLASIRVFYPAGHSLVAVRHVRLCFRPFGFTVTAVIPGECSIFSSFKALSKEVIAECILRSRVNWKVSAVFPQTPPLTPLVMSILEPIEKHMILSLTIPHSHSG